ncbi:MAG TPA: metallophosphoesterase family protein [Candidatus Bathyarchaeia archaeon]|nr:metallophosphoesterase family protein [Candidatus Bathyarchaeia archaeon]
MISRPRFLKPSLGRPAFLSANERELEVLVISPGGAFDRDALAGGFSLVPVSARGPALPLGVRDLREVDGPSRKSPLGRALKRDAFSFYSVRLSLDADQPQVSGPRSLLFDLSHPLLDGGRHAVALVSHSWESFRFWFATDAHVSARWDRIQGDLDRLPEDFESAGSEAAPSLGRSFGRRSFEENFVNPNRNLACFIRLANEAASRGELDLVVFGGDLVDYQIPSAEGYRKGAPAETNFDLFEGIVRGRTGHGEELRVPLLTVPGNHDHRLYPYEIHHYGLDRCGWHDLQTGYFLRKTDPGSPRSYSFRDLRAVFGRAGRTHPLESYLVGVNPDADHAWTAGRTKFIFLDSGRDAFRNFLHIRPRRWPHFIRAAVSSWYYPNSAGLTDAQTRFLARESEGEGPDTRVLIFHAGLVNTRFTAGGGRDAAGAQRNGADDPSAGGESRLPVGIDEDLRGPDRFRRRFRWERMVVRAGLNYGGLFQNQLPLLRSGLAGERRVLGLSGHFHRPWTLRLDKTTGDLFSRRPGQDSLEGSQFKDSSFFLAAGALGHVQARYPVAAWPEYLDIRVAEDGFSSVRRERLTAFPFDRVSFEARKIEETRASATIAVLSELRSPEVMKMVADLRLRLTFIVFASPDGDPNSGTPFDILAQGLAGSGVAVGRWLSEEERREYLGENRPAFVYSALFDYAPVIECEFRRRGRSRKPAFVVALAEYLRDTGNGLESLRLAWHPRSLKLGRG